MSTLSLILKGHLTYVKSTVVYHLFFETAERSVRGTRIAIDKGELDAKKEPKERNQGKKEKKLDCFSSI